MFYTKISFFIVLMLYVICFAHDSSDDDKFYEDTDVGPSDVQQNPNVDPYYVQPDPDIEPSHVQQSPNVRRSNFHLDLNAIPVDDDVDLPGFTKCVQSMKSVFKDEDPIHCVRYALKNMILYGEHKTQYPYDVEMYCKTFHSFLYLDFVKLPAQFCIRDKHPDPTIKNKIYNPYCYAQIEIFLDVEDMDYGGEQNDLKKRVVMNALYCHKIGDEDYFVPDDKLKYFHVTHSFGLLYINHIARAVKLNTELDGPWTYCRKTYLNL